MAGYIKGITIEFGADTTKLNNALKKTQSTINKTQSELKQINRSLKFNPRNTTLLQQKFKLLSASVEQTRGKLNQLRQMQAKMEASGIDRNSAQYRELQREIIKTENQLKRAEGELKRFGSVGKQQALAVGNAFKTAGGKIKSAGRSIITAVSVYGMAGIYAGSKLIEMSQKQAQAEQKLVEIYRTRMGASKKLANGTINLAGALQKQGVVGDEVTLSFAQQMATYSKAPATVNKLMPAFTNLLVQQKGLNGTQEDAVNLANMFGKAMMGQTGALKRAGISFTNAQAEVMKYGTEEEKAAMIAEVITQNVGNMNEEFAKTDAGKIQQAKNALGDMGEEIGAILLPAVADLVSWLQVNLLPKLQQFINFMKQHQSIAKFALAFALITAAVGPVLLALGGLISVVGSLITIGTTLAAAIAAISAPVMAVVAAIAAAIAIGVLLYRNWDLVKAKAVQVWNAIKKAMLAIIKIIVTRVVNNFNILKKRIISVWASIRTWISAIVNGIKTNVTSIFSAIKTRLSNTVSNIKSSIVNKFSSLKSSVSSTFSALKTTVANIWNNIKTAITKPINDAKDKVKGILKKIKGYFPLKLNKIVSFSLPKISVGSKSTKVGDKNVKSPTFSVGGWNHYAKAANTPYMFNRPTGIVVGDAAQDEIVYGRNSLLRDIAAASGGGIDYGRLAASIVNALSSVDGNVCLYVDGKKMAQAQAPYMNIAINQVQARQARTYGIVGV